MKNAKRLFLYSSTMCLLLFLNSCSNSHSFEGYHPEQRLKGKGYGYGEVNHPQKNGEVVVVGETSVENTPTPDTQLETPITGSEDAATPDVTTETVTADAPVEESNKLSPREQKWVNKLGVNTLIDPTAVPQKTNFMQRLMMKMYSKIAQRQLNKQADIKGVQRMDIADIFAIVSLASGGIAFLTFYGVFLFGIAGIVFGILALRRGTGYRGMAIAGIALGAVALFFWIFIFGFFYGTPWFVN